MKMTLQSEAELKKGGPYTELQREKIQEQIHKFYFDYKYSSRKISSLMKINRGTVTRYIKTCYKDTARKIQPFLPSMNIVTAMERLQIQRERLREQLDSVVTFKDRMTLERMICDIDCKIIFINQKLNDSTILMHKRVSEKLNDWMVENKTNRRVWKLFDTLTVSKDANEKIKKIIDEDKKQKITYEVTHNTFR